MFPHARGFEYFYGLVSGGVGYWDHNHIASENRRVHAAMVDELDREIGRILQTLESEAMLHNTIVFFASDNGGLIRSTSGMASTLSFLSSAFGRPLPGAGLEFLASNFLDGGSDNSPLFRGKADVAEGGVRVPAAIWWPGTLEARTHENFMSISDLLPTLLDAIGEPQANPDDLGGRSQWGVLTQRSKSETPD